MFHVKHLGCLFLAPMFSRAPTRLAGWRARTGCALRLALGGANVSRETVERGRIGELDVHNTRTGAMFHVKHPQRWPFSTALSRGALLDGLLVSCLNWVTLGGRWRSTDVSRET